jgi:hypothetical protein
MKDSPLIWALQVLVALVGLYRLFQKGRRHGWI